MFIKDILWPLPFICFCVGYYILSAIYTQPTVTTPALMGTDLVSAIQTLSAAHLIPRILAQKQDPDLPEGLILSQTPAAHQLIKIGQPVYLVISKKPKDQPTPTLIGKSAKAMKKIVRKQKIHEKLYRVPSNTPSDMVIGQSPAPRLPCINNSMIIYCPEPANTPMLFPNLRKKSVTQVKQFLNEYGIKPRIEHMQTKNPNHTCTSCKVVKQKPAAKAFVDLDKKLNIILWVN